jgi:2-oxoglutarate ferredoxin oxidoreductase subunit alpha
VDLPAMPKLAPAATDTTRWSITGNEATGLGAVRGGVRFVAAYPITPATEVLEWLAPALKKVGGVLVQAEDELASVTQIIGGSFGGTPALTATAGPGLALMMESIGLAVASETPIVVVDVMRGGPSTGIPTKSEQSDLNIAVYGLHGDAPHIVVAPVSLGDCLFSTQWAVHLAEAMQTAAIVLSDQSRPADVAFLAKRETPAVIDENYKRYALTGSGVSPMAIPGMAGGQYTADGLEHAESGTPSSSDVDHSAQMDKRLRKLEQFNFGDHWADIDGVSEALDRVRADGGDARLIKIRLLSPVQPERFAAALEGVKRVLIVEQTHSGQFYRYLRAHYDLPADVQVFAKPGPLPIRPAEIVDRLANWS